MPTLLNRLPMDPATHGGRDYTTDSEAQPHIHTLSSSSSLPGFCEDCLKFTADETAEMDVDADEVPVPHSPTRQLESHSKPKITITCTHNLNKLVNGAPMPQALGEGDHRSDSAPDQNPLKDEMKERETAGSLDEATNVERCTQEDVSEMPKRRCRKQTLRDRTGAHCCPVCGVSIRSGEMTAHLQYEVDKLNKLAKGRRSHHSKEQVPKKPVAVASSSTGVPDGNLEVLLSVPGNRFETYQRIRTSRQARINSKIGNKRRRTGQETLCPVCSEVIDGTSDELNAHVDQCLQSKGEDNDEVDVEGEFEEYTWCGQTRIRVSSFIEGGLSDAGFKTVSKVEDEDEDVNLCVDDDDADVYGNNQYTEADVIPCSSSDPKEDKQTKALRKAFLMAEKLKDQKPETSDRVRWKSSSSKKNKALVENGLTSVEDGNSITTEQDIPMLKIIESLKAHIAEQDKLLSKTKEPPKCLICMEMYHKPVTSIQCWHVHCEECWLRTLGAKKLCPQCNTITSSADLRQIYL